MPKGLTKSTKENIVKILFILKQAPGIHLRGIGRALNNMNSFTVSSIIDRYLSPFIDIKPDNRYGLKTKTIYLKQGKENTSLEDVLRYYEARKRAKGKSATEQVT